MLPRVTHVRHHLFGSGTERLGQVAGIAGIIDRDVQAPIPLHLSLRFVFVVADLESPVLVVTPPPVLLGWGGGSSSAGLLIIFTVGRRARWIVYMAWKPLVQSRYIGSGAFDEGECGHSVGRPSRRL